MERRLLSFRYTFLLQRGYSPLNYFTNNRFQTVIIAMCILLSLTSTCTAQTQCTEGMGCFPPIGNLAIGRSINTSTTCAVGSEYCRFFTPDCFSCLPQSANSASSINDNNNNTAWYSAIGPNGVLTNLQIDFEAPVMFQGMTMVWDSVRPRSMQLERSQDFGATWQVYRYYSSSCSDSFMLPDTTVTDSSFFNTTNPICTSTESQLFPFRDGLVTFSTSQHVLPDSADAMDYRTVTNLRVQLFDQFVELELSGSSFQYYALSEWLIWGSCLCNGHASMCTPGSGEMLENNRVYTGCICEHNTEGNSCDVCQEGFNSAPWMPGTLTDANRCQECMCNGHASDCEYVASQSSAVCLNCTDNTTGDNCDLCLPGFYQDEALLLNDAAICNPCNCNPIGIVDSGLCAENGQCNCKVNVDQESLDCSQCGDGYWNLTESNIEGCQVCDCNIDGSILADGGLPLCDKDTGECFCREGATGDQCDGCMPGFYDITAGCRPCQCNQGGSLGPVCDQSSDNAQCPCIPNVESITCRVPTADHFSKALDDIVFEAELATLVGESVVHIPSAGSTGPFTGQGFVSLVSFSSVRFVFTVPRSTQYELIMRYEASTPASSVAFTLVSLDEVTFDLNCDVMPRMNVSRFNFASILESSERFYVIDSVCLSTNVSYQLTVEDTSFLFTTWLIDSVLLLPDFSAISAYYDSQSAQDQSSIIELCLPRQASESQILLPECEEPTFTLSTEFYESVFPCDCDPVGSSSPTCYPYSGSCSCQSNVTGRQCDRCVQGTFNLTESGCQACDCNSIGSVSPVCDQDDGGSCMCQSGIGGRRCDQCLEGFYNFTATGCTPCQCSEYALLDDCDSDGQCTCPYGITGLRCEQCQENFYNISIDGCTPCNCDLNGSVSTACDPTTGECTCIGGTVGQDCSQCPDGFFQTDGDIRDRCVRCICMGRTNECAQDDESYGLGLILSNFSSLCQYNPSDCDDGWTIRTLDGELAAPYGPSDSNGLGYILLINHMPMLYAPEAFLGDRVGTYGLHFSVVLRISNTGALNVNTTIIRIIGAEFEQELIGIFPFPTVTPNGFGAERYLEYTIQFIEDNWHIGTSTGPPPTYHQFIRVLLNLTELSFSAQYTEDIIEFVHIVNISLESLLPAESFLNSSDVDLSMSLVPIIYPFPTEDCQCPDNYTGRSCEDCSEGFTLSSRLPTDTCVRCDCNNQSSDCDPLTGVCVNCQGNTQGEHCEQCAAGYYGDPTRGIECLLCRCPLVANSFSATCYLNETDGLPVCDNCATGYTGRNCELCMNGYFGSPLMGRCTTCECNGNVDPELGPVCNTTTGQCLNCRNNTTGFECKLCLPGYFGGSQIGKSCLQCPCDPRGSVGDCDSLFGTCTCQTGVTGQLCNECIDGYWGIAQGCIPCDCCTNGTLGGVDICDKDTGACSCNENVGSDVDDKCCNCTPGYFNLTDQGCQACNCSSLAVSEECDQVTGACACQDGAQGLKCDDCEFGYIGQVPDCERCHDCFFQLDDEINNLTRRISELQSEIDYLTEEYFNNTDTDIIMMEIDQLLADLEEINNTLNSFNLQESSLDELQQMIINMNITITAYFNQIEEIEQELVDAQRMLDRAIAFDGTVNMTTVNELQSDLLAVNSSLAAEYFRANRNVTLLLRDAEMINDTWTELNMLNETVQELIENLTIGRMNTEEARDLLQNFNETHDSLRRNITLLAVRFDMLQRQFLSINATAANISVYLDNAEVQCDELETAIDTKMEEANETLGLAVQLNSTINSTQAVVQMTLDSVNQLLNSVMESIVKANSTLSNISDALAVADAIAMNITRIEDAANRILNLSIDFSVSDAEALAREINDTILPPEVIDQIVQNATFVKQAANQTVECARQANSSAMELQSLVEQVQDDINSTTVLQQQVTENITTIQDMVDDTFNQIDQILDIATEVNNCAQEVEDIVNNATEKILSSKELGMNNSLRALQLQESATNISEQAQQGQRDIYQAVEDYNNLEPRISAAKAEANASLAEATDLKARADELYAESTRVSLQDVQDLLRQYTEESAELERLQREVTELEERLEYLTESFERASKRLQNCYKTP